jgi:alkanesulfonate monooxygenase SsuD/methylene tetrahydromethanopterin reductase-like flavin-dependent oxidoreductase (luciferase family)
MIGVPLIAAPTDDEAQYLASSVFQRVVGILRGRRTRLQPPQPNYLDSLSAQERMGLADFLACAVIGSPDTVRTGLQTLARETGCDEMIFTCDIHDPALRLRSLDIAVQVRG